jgi:DNA-binding transcriptional regulator YiaG
MNQTQSITDMSPDEYRAAIKALGYTQIEFAELLGAKPRTGQYWANVAVPGPVQAVVLLLQKRPELKAVLEELAERRDEK